MKVIGKTRVFKDEYNGNTYYKTSISNKNAEGKWENLYISVQFKKGMETEGDIEIKDSFLSFFKTKEGLSKIKLVVLDYAKEEQNDFMDINPAELPF